MNTKRRTQARLPELNRAKLAVAAVLTLSVGLVTACGGDGESGGDPKAAQNIAASCGGEESDWSALIEDARAEGKVVVTGPPNPDVSEALPEAFQETFGIEVEYIAGASGETAQKIASERQADIHSFDIVFAGGNTMANVIYGGKWLADLRDEVISPDILDEAVWRGDASGRPFVDEPDLNSVAKVSIQVGPQFIVNTDMVGEEIQGWEDLLDPRWKGKIVAMDPTTGAGLSFNLAVMLHEKFGTDFIESLFNGQEVVLQTDARQAADGVAKGQYAVAIGVSESVGGLSQLIEDGLPVSVVAPDDALPLVDAGYGEMGLFEPAAHPAAGKLFANWILCPEGSEVWNEASGFEASRSDVEIDVPEFLKADTDQPYWDTYDWKLLTSNKTAEVLDDLNRILK